MSAHGLCAECLVASLLRCAVRRVACPGTDGGGIEGKGAGGASLSMVLTSTPLWRCTTERNRIIPTISIGCFDVGRVNVSAVDTGLPAGSTPRGPGGRAGCSRPDAGSGPSPALNLSSPRGWGSTGRGLCVLHEGPTYLECTRPSSSGSRPSCSAGQAASERLRSAEPAPASLSQHSEQRPSGPLCRCLEVPWPRNSRRSWDSTAEWLG